jgi:hypothetical protein
MSWAVHPTRAETPNTSRRKVGDDARRDPKRGSSGRTRQKGSSTCSRGKGSGRAAQKRADAGERVETGLGKRIGQEYISVDR